VQRSHIDSNYFLVKLGETKIRQATTSHEVWHEVAQRDEKGREMALEKAVKQLIIQSALS
jgi:hypothetical protein